MERWAEYCQYHHTASHRGTGLPPTEGELRHPSRGAAVCTENSVSHSPTRRASLPVLGRENSPPRHATRKLRHAVQKQRDRNDCKNYRGIFSAWLEKPLHACCPEAAAITSRASGLLLSIITSFHGRRWHARARTVRWFIYRALPRPEWVSRRSEWCPDQHRSN